MPVTARLSSKFYERFGDEVTNELVDWFNQVDATYRSELKDLNELNFARFDAKLEQRVAELRQEMHAGFASQIKWMFGFWAATTLTLIGTTLALVKFLGA